MAYFDQTILRRIQQAIDIVELIGERISLKKAGKDYKGLCPFHGDKNPSLHVSPSKQIFKCFACSAGGDVFKFIQLADRVEFPDAVRTLAARANIELVETRGGDRQPGFGKVALADANKWAARKFRDWLTEPGGEPARKYLEGRGFTEQTIRRFGLGYAPPGWDNLLNAARADRKDQALLAAAGLISESRRLEKSGSYFDMFRGRVMFPILDAADRVIGFGGRTLGDDNPKYLNTGETPLFNKGRELYGLRWARQTITETETVCVVEGYTDVLMAHQGGVGNVVAALGTALTDQHVKVLARLAKTIVVIFDADTAGDKAADRALDLFLSAGVDVKVATMPDGLDPCDLIRRDGPEPFRQAMANAQDALEYKWRTVSRRFDVAGNTADRAAAAETMLATLANSAGYAATDPIRRGLMLDRLAGLLKVSAGELNRMLVAMTRRRRPAAPHADEPEQRDSPPPDAEPARPANRVLELALAQALGVLLNEPSYFDSVRQAFKAADLSNPRLRALAEKVFELGESSELSLTALLRTIESPELANLATDLADRTERLGDLARTLQQAVGTIEHQRALEHARLRAERVRSGQFTDDDLLALSRRPRDLRRVGG